MCVNYLLTCLDYESNVIANSDLQSYKFGFLKTITLHRNRFTGSGEDFKSWQYIFSIGCFYLLLEKGQGPLFEETNSPLRKFGYFIVTPDRPSEDVLVT